MVKARLAATPSTSVCASGSSEGSEMGQRGDKGDSKGLVVVTDLKSDALSLETGSACQPDFWGAGEELGEPCPRLWRLRDS